MISIMEKRNSNIYLSFHFITFNKIREYTCFKYTYIYKWYSENIELVKYLEKYTSDQKVKKYIFNIFEKLSNHAKMDDLLPPPGGGERETTLKFQMEVSFFIEDLDSPEKIILL